jgi:hypothetical protein
MSRCRRIGQRRIGQVEQLAPLLVLEAPQVERVEPRPKGRHGEAGPARNVVPGRRSEAAEIAPDEMDEPLGLGRLRRAQPIVGQPEQVCPPPLPRAGRRDPDHVDDLVASVPGDPRESIGLERGEQVLVASRAVG